jgi:hypothetical protein
MMQIPGERAQQYRIRVPVVDFWNSALLSKLEQNLNPLDTACGIFCLLPEPKYLMRIIPYTIYQFSER